MKKLVATAVALAVGASVAMAEPNANDGKAAPVADKPAAQSQTQTHAPKVAKKHHKHHKHHKEKAEKQAEQKPADNQNEQSK